MTVGLSSNLEARLRFLSWPIVLVAILVFRAVASLAPKPVDSFWSYGGISYFLLLLLAIAFAIRNGIENTLGVRPFWVLLAIGYALWALDQCIFLYHEFVLHTDVPDNSIADPLLFLHIVPFMAAVTALPSQNGSSPRLYRVISNSLLLLFFWSFLYVFTIFPYQYLFSNTTSYALRFDILYLLATVALVFAVALSSLRTHFAWKSICLHLLGASALYALSSAVANIAIDSGGYVPGKLYGLGLTASACWFAWIPLRARRVRGAESGANLYDTGQASQASAWAMLVIVVIAVPLVWELFQKDDTAGVRTFRLLVAVAAVVCLAGLAYIEEHFARNELISKLSLANDRLHLAMEAGKSVGWEWNLKTGRLSWFGDLQTMLGIPSETYVGRMDGFFRHVHPEDRQMVAKAVADTRLNRKPYAAEFRVVTLDGTVRWVTATGQFYYSANGDPERMLGMAVDITERRHSEEALRLFRKLIDQTTDAIEVVEPKTLRFLDVNDKSCRDLGYTREELLSLKVHDIDPGVDESRLVRITKELEQSGSVTFESLHQRKDGSTYPVEVNLARVNLERSYNVNVVRDITQRKQAEDALRQTGEELKRAQHLAGLGSWHWDARTDTTIWSEELYRLHDRDPNLPAPPYKEHPSLFTAESWDRLEGAVKDALEAGTSYELDLEIIGSGPTTKWVIGRGEPVRDAHGQIMGLRGTVQDITARKLADAALASVSGKLIEAQEQERRRIARELHDDIGQRLALLTIELARLQQSSSNPSEFPGRIAKIQMQTSEVAADVQSLSHQLHSSKLQYLGLPAALRGFCQEFSKQQKVEVDFKAQDLPTSLSPEISLCFFRVLQEALHNAAKHSGVRHFEVDLWTTPDEIHLTIIDSGVGFDVEAVKSGGGLGLISMRERLKILNGILRVESRLERGTTIHASVPLTSNIQHG